MVIVTTVVAPTIDFGTARSNFCVADPVLIEVTIYSDNLLQPSHFVDKTEKTLDESARLTQSYRALKP